MLDNIKQRQLDLGPAGFFRAEAETPPGNQVVVKAGFLFAGAHRVYDRFTAGDQVTAGFASISGPGFKRYDLVYVDATGAVQIAMGTEVALAAPAYQGGPGFTGGPDLPDQAIPVAYILVTETGAVTVIATDITNIAGIFYIARDLDGYLVDKGLLGVPPTGASDVVTALFVGEVPGGSASQRGVVTAPPTNYVGIVDQNGDELIRLASSSRIFGRITEAAGVWTLSYFYIDAAGVETAVVAIETETEGGAPTNLRLIGTPKVFSRNDPTRPLFDSTVYRLSDQIVGDIPTATTTVQGKVIAALNSPNPPQAGATNVIQNAGAPVAGGPFHTINFSAGAAAGGAGIANVTLSAGPTGPPGPAGPAGPAGPPGPGFASYIYQEQTVVLTAGTNGTGNFVFAHGFTPRMASAALGNTTAFTTGAGAETQIALHITNIAIAGVNVTVSYAYDLAGVGGNLTIKAWCTAAG